MTISVVVPSYNRAALVLLTLDSVLAQSRPADEVLVVDDGSTDGTGEAVAAYSAARGGRVGYVWRENGGLSAARNTGLAACSGEAVVMLDNDDLLLPGALGALEAALEAAPDAPVAYCRAQLIDADGAILGPWGEAENFSGDHEGQVWHHLARGNFIRSTGATLIRRSFLERAGPWDVSMSVIEDWDMWLRLAELGPFVRVEEPLFQYRLHAGTMSTNKLRDFRRFAQLYQSHLRRHARDGARSKALADGDRVFRIAVTNYLTSEAHEARQRGDAEDFIAKMRFAVRLWPRSLLRGRVFWPWLSTHKPFFLLACLYWFLDRYIFSFFGRAYWFLHFHTRRLLGAAGRTAHTPEKHS